MTRINYQHAVKWNRQPLPGGFNLHLGPPIRLVMPGGKLSRWQLHLM